MVCDFFMVCVPVWLTWGSWGLAWGLEILIGDAFFVIILYVLMDGVLYLLSKSK